VPRRAISSRAVRSDPPGRYGSAVARA
jgi:hypothetical protein